MREKYSVYLALASGCLIFLVTILFALLQSPEILTASVQRGGAMPHPFAGKEQCDTCHGFSGIKPYPIRHLGWSNGSCIRCHPSPDMPGDPPKAPVSDSKVEAAPIPHPVKGHEACNSCHESGTGSIPAPADHAGWDNKSCEGCHLRGNGESK